MSTLLLCSPGLRGLNDLWLTTPGVGAHENFAAARLLHLVSASPHDGEVEEPPGCPKRTLKNHPMVRSEVFATVLDTPSP